MNLFIVHDVISSKITIRLIQHLTLSEKAKWSNYQRSELINFARQLILNFELNYFDHMYNLLLSLWAFAGRICLRVSVAFYHNARTFPPCSFTTVTYHLLGCCVRFMPVILLPFICMHFRFHLRQTCRKAKHVTCIYPDNSVLFCL